MRTTDSLLLRILLFLVLCGAPVFAGSVVTRDGKTIQGQVAPAGAAIRIAQTNGETATIEWANIQRASFENTPPATPPLLDHTSTHADIGKVHVAGSVSEKDGAFTITGSGWGAWGPKDSGHFVYWPLEGDGQIMARVVSHGDESIGAMAGVMFRASLDPDSAFGSSLIYPSGETRFNRRPIEGYAGGPDHHLNAVPYEWLRLTRSGNMLTASRSRDGQFWLPIHAQAVDLPTKVYAGLFVSAGTNTLAAPATFDHVRLIPGPPSPSFFEGAVGPASGVVFVDGTMLAGHPRAISEGNVQIIPAFTRNGQKIDWPVTDENRLPAPQLYMLFPQAAVARIRFTCEPPNLEKINPGRGTGVLLFGGDFLEGEVTRLAYGQWLDLNSVVFGAKRLDVPRDLICAVLREVKPDRAAYEVRLRDGSIIQAKSVAFASEMIEVDSALAGTLKFPIAEVLSVEAQHL